MAEFIEIDPNDYHEGPKTVEESIKTEVGEDEQISDELSKLSIKELIRMGVEMRDEYREETRKYNSYKRSYDDMAARIGMAIKEKADELGIDSFKSDEGTAYRNRKEKYQVVEWPRTLQFMIETNNFQMLEKRVAKRAVQEVHRATGVVPPGLEFIVEEVFAIRRPNERNSDE